MLFRIEIAELGLFRPALLAQTGRWRLNSAALRLPLNHSLHLGVTAMRISNFRPHLFVALALVAIAGCSKADNVVAPPAGPSFDGGWGYGSGGRSAADSTGNGPTQQQGTQADTGDGFGSGT